MMLLVSNLEARKIQTVFSIWKLSQLTQKKKKKQAKKQEQTKEPEQNLWIIKLLPWKTWHN